MSINVGTSKLVFKIKLYYKIGISPLTASSNHYKSVIINYL